MSLILHSAKAPTPHFIGIIRDMRPLWLLEELGIPFERKVRDPKKGETQSAEYLAIQPIGKVPCLEDGDFKLYESAAICEYLATKHKKFTPMNDSPEFFLARQWNYFTMANLDNACGRIFGCDFFSEASDFNTQIRETFSKIVLRFLPVVEAELKDRDWLLKSGFSVSDILLVTSLCYLKGGRELEAFPNLQQYIDRAKARPAFQRALSVHGR